MTENKATAETVTIHQVKGLVDANYYEALYQIIQDAQAAGSVVQIVTIWPSSQTVEDGSDIIKPTKCAPTGVCPK